MHLSLQKVFFAIATIFALFASLILAKTILIPLSFAFIISLLLYPMVKLINSWKVNKIIAAFISILVVLLIIGGGIFLFSAEIIAITKDFSDFRSKILRVIAEATIYINGNLNFIPDLEKNDLVNLINDWFRSSTGSLVSQTFSNTASFLAGMLATIIFTFLFLIYSSGLITALSSFYAIDRRKEVRILFKSIQQVGQKYLAGMVILILVIGFANSLGLLLIGIENPFLFGFLGAILAIIPYVGTVSGAILPILYAFFSYGSMWMSIEIAILFWGVQLVSDNFLSPKIVGGNMNINAFTAILSLIVGGVVWGIAGMILFLPFAAIVRVVCEEYQELKPFALLIGNENYQENSSGNSFINKWSTKVKKWHEKFHKSS